MHAAADTTRPSLTSAQRVHFTFWSLGAGADQVGVDGDLMPETATVQDRIRRLPGAVLLTAGYYASRVGILRRLLKPRD